MQHISEAPSIAGPGHNLATTTDVLRDRFQGLIEEVDELADSATKARENLGESGKIINAEQCEPLIKLGVDAGKLSKRLDETRLSTTLPLRDEVSETNNFFNAMVSRMDRVKSTFEDLVDVFAREKRIAEQRAAAEAARVAEEEARAKLAEAEQAEHSVVSDVVLNEAIQAEEKAARLAAVATSVGSTPLKTDGGTASSSKPWTFSVVDWSKIDVTELRDQFTVAELEKAIRGHVRKHKNTRPLKGVRIFQDEKTTFRG